MTRESLPHAAVIKPALPADSELVLEHWPRWMRDALAIQPEAELPTNPGVVAEPGVRKLTRMPSRS